MHFTVEAMVYKFTVFLWKVPEDPFQLKVIIFMTIQSPHLRFRGELINTFLYLIGLFARIIILLGPTGANDTLIDSPLDVFMNFVLCHQSQIPHVLSFHIYQIKCLSVL